jgi:signal peptidase I
MFSPSIGYYQAMQSRPAVVMIAIIAAILVAILDLVAAVLRNPILAIPPAIVATVAAVGLIRGKRWAGYGFALFLVCSTAAPVIASLHLGGTPSSTLLVAAIIPLLIAAFAFLAGNALPGDDEGHVGWMVVSAIPLVFYLLFDVLIMPTGSMQPTLLVGDSIIARWAGAASLKRGDLVIYRDRDHHSTMIKRVVGLGGDRIHLDRKTLYVNGQAVSEPFAIHTTTYLDQYRDNFPMGENTVPLPPGMQEQLAQDVKDGDFVVPPATFFVLGDNRDMSLDSRYVGVVPADAVIGRPWLICFSTDLPTESLSTRPAPHNVLAHARWDRVMKRL